MYILSDRDYATKFVLSESGTGLWRFSVNTRVTTDDGRPSSTPVIQEYASVQLGTICYMMAQLSISSCKERKERRETAWRDIFTGSGAAEIWCLFCIATHTKVPNTQRKAQSVGPCKCCVSVSPCGARHNLGKIVSKVQCSRDLTDDPLWRAMGMETACGNSAKEINAKEKTMKNWLTDRYHLNHRGHRAHRAHREVNL